MYDRKRFVDLIEKLGDSNSRDLSQAWSYGVVAAAIPAAYGVWCMIARSAIFFRSRPLGIATYTGSEAVSVGVAYLSVGLFIHFHWFWSTHERYPVIGQLGKIAALMGFVAGIGYLIYSVVMLK